MINWIKHEEKIMIGIMAFVIIIGIIGCINFFHRNQLKQTNDTYTHEAGQELILHPADFFEVDEEKAAQVSFDTSAVNKDIAGEYVATAKFKNKSFEIKVTVVDTTAPMVEFANRYVFTNDIENANFDNTFAGVYDASEWSAKLVRFEYKENLSVLDEDALKRFTDTIPVPCEEEELMAIGTTDIPTEEGVYRAVMEIADAHGNYRLEEVYVIYDTTGARIDDTPDKTVEVAKEDLDKEPTIDKNDYSITDNVDGDISSENINCELELRDADKNKDGIVDSQEAMDNISPSEQALIDAGYGVVTLLPTGDYGVLMQGPEHTVNGKKGDELLKDYLTGIGLEGSISGGWMNSQYYNYFAENVHEIDNSDSLQGGEIIFGDE